MEREIYGVEQSNHGHLYRWVFTREGLLKWDIEPPKETMWEDIGFPIGGSNSSATYIVKLNTEEETRNFLLAEYHTDYDDPMLVDIAEGIFTIDTDDDYHGSITSEYVKLFGIPEDELTRENSLVLEALKLIDTMKEYDTDGRSGFDYENPFYGESRYLRLSDLEDILDEFKKRKMNKYRVMVVKYGYAVVEAEDETEALGLINDMDDRDFDWSDFDEGQVVEEIDYE